MTDLASKFSALETQLTAQNEAILAAMSTLSGTLASIDASLSTLNDNGATNTQYLLAAIGQNNPCNPCPTPSLEVPVISPTPHPVNADKCLRTQALLYCIEQLCVKMDALSAFSVAFAPQLLIDAFNEVYAEFFAADSVPPPSWIEALGLVANAVSYVAGNILVGDTLTGAYVPLLEDLRQAIFLTSTPADAQEAFISVIGSGVAHSGTANLLDALAYIELFNYFLDPANVIDTTGFDGSVCGLPSGCLTFTPEQWIEVATESGTSLVPDLRIYGFTFESNPGHFNPVWVNFDFSLWTWTYGGAGLYYTEAIGTGYNSTLPAGSFPDFGTTQLTVFTAAVADDLQLCPPEIG